MSEYDGLTWGESFAVALLILVLVVLGLGALITRHFEPSQLDRIEQKLDRLLGDEVGDGQ